MRLSKSGSDGFGIAGAVDLAHQVAGGHRLGGGARRAVEAVHLPADRGPRCPRPSGSRAARGRRPGRRSRRSAPTGRRCCGPCRGGRRRSRAAGRARPGAASPGPVRAKKLWPKPKVTVSEDGPRVPGDVRVVVRGGLARHQPLRPCRDQRRSSAAASLRPAPGRQVEGDEVAAGLEGVGDAGLMFPVKHRRVRADRVVRRPAAPAASAEPRLAGGRRPPHRARARWHRRCRAAAAARCPARASRWPAPATGVARCFPWCCGPLVDWSAMVRFSRSARSCRRSPGRCRRSGRSPRSSSRPPWGSGPVRRPVSGGDAVRGHGQRTEVLRRRG